MEKSNVNNNKKFWGVLLEFRGIGLTKWGCLVCKKVERERENEVTEKDSLYIDEDSTNLDGGREKVRLAGRIGT